MNKEIKQNQFGNKAVNTEKLFVRENTITQKVRGLSGTLKTKLPIDLRERKRKGEREKDQ